MTDDKQFQIEILLIDINEQKIKPIFTTVGLNTIINIRIYFL